MAEWLREYVQHSRDCRTEAANASNAAERDHLLDMADRWEKLARQRAAFMHLEDVLNDYLKESGGNSADSPP